MVRPLLLVVVAGMRGLRFRDFVFLFITSLTGHHNWIGRPCQVGPHRRVLPGFRVNTFGRSPAGENCLGSVWSSKCHCGGGVFFLDFAISPWAARGADFR